MVSKDYRRRPANPALARGPAQDVGARNRTNDWLDLLPHLL